jgi:putative peptidoglycan lipid II flippase
VTVDAEPTQGLLARRAGVVGAAILGSRILGLVREQVFAIVFGAGRELDAFVTAFRIPNLLRDLFAEGALSAAFVTTFSQTLTRDGAAAAWRLANLVINSLLLVLGPIVAVSMFWAPEIVRWIAPGFDAIPGKTALTVEMTRIMFPFLLMVALAAVAMGVLNSRNVFGVPASASSFFNLGSIVGGLVCAYLLAPDFIRSAVGAGTDAAVPRAPDAGRAIVGMAVGTLIGGCLQFLVQVPALRGVGFRYRPVLAARDPALHQVLALMAPATVGAAAVQVNVLVNNNFASYLGDGAVSWLNVAFRFMQLPIGLFGVGVGVVTLPLISRRAAQGDTAAMRRTVSDGLELALLFAVPAACGLVVLGTPIVGLIYEHGRFTATDTHAAAGALAGYAAGLAGYAGIKIVAPAFYALGDVRTPMRVSVISILVNYAANWFLVRGLDFGHVGLALSTSAVATLNFLWLFAVLRRRLGGMEDARLAATLLRVGAATALMGLCVYGVDAAVVARLGGDGAAPVALTYAARVAIGIVMGPVVFAAGCWALRLQLPMLASWTARRRRGAPPPPPS